ncbi:uncharacterized protein [Ptychodera flava]|uniref:uncharacterized protein n=1 Tax=Ptychodera flava TaxID=63121 RepID=UPI00396A4B6A
MSALEPMIPILELEEQPERKTTKWRVLIRLSLALLGFSVHAQYNRCVTHSTIDKEKWSKRTTDENCNINGQSSRHGLISLEECPVCESLNPHVNREGADPPLIYQRYASRLWLVLSTTLFGINLAYHVTRYFARMDFSLYILSYSVHFGTVFVIALFRLIAHLIPYCPSGTRCIYAMTSTQVLGMLNRKASPCAWFYVILYTLWPLVNIIVAGAYEIYPTFVDFECVSIDYWGVVSFVCETIGMFVFGSFWLIVLLLRKALQSDLIRVTKFLRENASDIEVSRKRVYESYLEFTRLDNLMSVWMTFQVAITAFKFSCHVYWNYFILNDDEVTVRATLINTLIWLQIGMFVVLPLLAVGGLNISYIWLKFMAKAESEQSESPSWSSLKMIKRLKPAGNNVILTIVFSALTVFISLRLQNQNGDYWVMSSICQTNATIVHP